jgi:mRNA interferase RelE/StbE
MYSIQLDSSVRPFLKGLEAKRAKQVVDKLFALQEDPHPQASKALVAHKGFFRLRAGDYRVIYEIVDKVIRVKLIDNRGDDEVYNRLDRML